MQMMLSDFLECLFRDGRVCVPGLAALSDRELGMADRALAAFEQQYRLELPATPPAVLAPAARWAAVMFYRACQFVAFRDADEGVVAKTLTMACPEGEPPAVHYSVDLTFRFLPSLVKLAQSAAQNDPLLTHFDRWATDWPLSSVGMAVAGPVQIGPWACSPCLLGLYVDRVIACGDASRLAEPIVRAAVQQAIGPFSELAPRLTISHDAASHNLALENAP
jgi:hypothetical protein